MRAAKAILAANAAGLQVTIEDADLAVEGPAEPPAGVMESLSRHKVEIIALLRERNKGLLEDRHSMADVIERLRIADPENPLLLALTRLDNALSGLEALADRFLKSS